MISVKEKLPQGNWSTLHLHLSEEVLIYDGLDFHIGYYNRDTESWFVNEPYLEEQVDDVSHWQPLPEKPKTEEKDRL